MMIVKGIKESEIINKLHTMIRVKKDALDVPIFDYVLLKLAETHAVSQSSWCKMYCSYTYSI